jgi:hypothetical protein
MRPGRSATVALGALALALLAPAPGAVAGEWVAGDLHVHTTYSHDSYGGPGDDNTGIEEAYTAGHSVTSAFRLARSRGLDYLAITDHNDIRSQGDSGFGFGGVIAVPGYENSLMGHGQMLGARRIYDKGDSGAQAVTAMAAELRADGGLLQANHPSDPLWPYGYDVPVDAVEVWNLPWQYQPPLPRPMTTSTHWTTGRAGSTAARGSPPPAEATATGSRPSPPRVPDSRRRGCTRSIGPRRACWTGCGRATRSCPISPRPTGGRRRSWRPIQTPTASTS